LREELIKALGKLGEHRESLKLVSQRRVSFKLSESPMMMRVVLFKEIHVTFIVG